MRNADNPFEPGAGTKPPELAGRELIIEDAVTSIARGSKGRPIRGQVFYGLRGVGKTVLLREVSEIAVQYGGIVADLETPEGKRLAQFLAPSMRQILIELSAAAKAKAMLKKAASALHSFASVFKVNIADIGIEVKDPGGVAGSGDLEKDVTDLMVTVANAAKEQNRLVLLALDEMQYMREEDLAALITAIHKINQNSLPLGLFGAGLPQLLGKAGKAKSYSERLFLFVEIGALNDDDATKAIRDPIIAANATIKSNALRYILDKSQGYPYFLQEWGYRTWNAATKSPIVQADAIAAEQSTIRSLDASFFRVRFDRLTPDEKNYLRAMAELGSGPYESGVVAKVLGKNATQTAAVRSRVIAKGMAYSVQYGIIDFSVPLFGEFMKRTMPDFKRKTSRKQKARAKNKRRE